MAMPRPNVKHWKAAPKRFSPNPLILGHFAAKSTRASRRPPNKAASRPNRQKCLLLALSGHLFRTTNVPFYPRKRTFAFETSTNGQKRTFAATQREAT